MTGDLFAPIRHHYRGHWTFERCAEEALKYSTRSEYSKNSSSSYDAARRNSWLHLICGHMIIGRMPNRYWTFERCAEEALKYSTRSEFVKNSSSASQIASKKGWLDEICKHMVSSRKPPGYWTKERCAEEALKFNTRGNFQSLSRTAYSVSLKKGWLDEICKHMVRIRGDLSLRYVYEIACHDRKVVYVGLTCNLQRRFSEHLKTERIIENFDNPVITPLSGLISSDDAVKKEQETIEYYASKGYVVLNVAKGGSLGGSKVYWTKERCAEEALKYATRIDFARNSGSVYNIASKNNWISDICTHMVRLVRPKGYWTKERCAEEALKYTTRTDFSIGSKGAYKSAKLEGWLNDICDHMAVIKMPNGYWTKERCHEEAKKYTTRVDFVKNSKGAHSAAFRRGWIDDICSHMTWVSVPNGYWTKERCAEEAFLFNTRGEFCKLSNAAYQAARKNGWLDEFFPKPA